MNTSSSVRRALYRALHDPLTGLATRGLLLDQVNQALDRSGRRPAGWLAVLALDLDRFRLVNDALGHPAGDELLVEVARRLEGALRSTDTAARLGGDEFVILVEDLECEGEALSLAARLREVIAEPVRLSSGEQVVVTASVGIALAGAGPQSPAALLWDADAAMYRAKECGRDRVVLFEEGLRAQSLNRFRAEATLRHALDHQGLRLHYQPLVDLGTGTVTGAEALVRLQDPDRGLVPPGEFIAVAEDTGLILALGRWVIAEATRQAAAWHAAEAPGEFLTMSVNLSGRQLDHPGFLTEVVAALDAGERVAFVTLGDPNVYSTFSSLAEEVRARRPDVPVETVPGIMAFQDLAARSGVVVLEGSERLLLVSLAEGPEALDEAFDDPRTSVVVYKGGRYLPVVAERLAGAGRDGGAVVGELLGLPGERVEVLPEDPEPAGYLATVVVPPKARR